MSLGRRLFLGDVAAATCNADTLDIFGDSSCKAFYKLDYDASDESGDYNGTASGVTFGVDGEIDYAASFDGSNDTITLSSSFVSDFDVSAKSVSAWIKWDGKSTGYGMPFWMQGATLSNYRFGIQVTHSNGKLEFFLGDKAGYPSTTISANTWYHVAIVQNGLNLEGFVNGSSIGTHTTIAYQGTGADAAHIGSYRNSNYYWSGELDHMRFFNKALSSSEVSTLYAETACTYTCTTDTVLFPSSASSNLVAYYKLDGSADDESSNNYDGTATSTASYEFGRFGTAIRLNGTSEYIDTGFALDSSACSVSFWYLADTAGSQEALFYLQNRGGRIDIYVGASTNDTPTSSYESINLNSSKATTGWNHVTIDFTGWASSYTSGAYGSAITAKVYLNNSTATSLSPTPYGQSTNMRIGRSGGGHYFGGLIDQVRIYDKVLSSDEVTELYEEKQCYITKNGSDPFGDGDEIIFYKLDNDVTNEHTGYAGTNNSVTFSDDAILGTKSAVFGGDGDNVHINHTISITNYNFSCAFWMKTTQSGSGYNLVSLRDPWFQFCRGIQVASQYSFQIYDGTTVVHSTSSSYDVVHDGEWHHIAATHDGSNLNCYIDGVLVDSVASTLTSPSRTSTHNRIGVRGDGNTAGSYNGKVDSFRFFDRALDGDEVFKLYAEVIN